MNERIVLENAQFLNGHNADITIEKGFITEISAPFTSKGDRKDCTGHFISSGWIDMHAHAFSKLEPYGDHLDDIGIKQGVTTIVDAGSCGVDQISELLEEASDAKTNLLVFLNVSKMGLQRLDELSDLSWINRKEIFDVVNANDDQIVGLKARISKSVVKKNGLKPLILSRLLADDCALPLMVHIGSSPPSVKDVLTYLKKGDIVTHYLNGKNNQPFYENGKPMQELLNAINRGVLLDVGHGSASFSFEVAEQAKQNGIHFHTISTDIYRNNRLAGPVYSLANVMSKFLHIGYSLDEVIAGVTTNAANWLKRPELGRIQVGDRANLTLFKVEEGSFTLVDSEGVKRKASQMIKAKGVFINGEWYQC
ncbi:amidohydrolase/deacetylase family metallohydrolase [Halalkalibacter hemicellulosilyticus]|nr:amidohydrolase/deacetylase family metallohydrolase [Halalkalibacter hemicellulosilyticus]